MLTSLDQRGVAAVGRSGVIAAHVERLATLTQEAGLDGVVASLQEIAIVRRCCWPQVAIVTPGIRGAVDQQGDQSRTMSAAEAVAAGPTYFVVGRPIIAAPNPRAAAERIGAECRGCVIAS